MRLGDLFHEYGDNEAYRRGKLACLGGTAEGD